MVKAHVFTNLDGPTALKAEYPWVKSWEIDFPDVPKVGQTYIKKYHGNKECVLVVIGVNWREVTTGVRDTCTLILEVELSEPPRSKLLG